MKVYDIQAPTPQGSASKEHQAFLLAITFHEAALRSAVEVRDPTGAPVVALCPMIVAYAFAAELYLKSLASLGTGASAIKGHKLDLLFRRLSLQTQTDIAELYLARTGRDATALDGDLRVFASAFSDWRYIFEGEGQQLRVNLLVAFTQSVYGTIRRRCPHWEVRDHQDGRLRADPETPTMTVANLGGGVFLHMVDGTGGILNRPEA